jgi:arginyl-tRNA--protein-N-Asp/Glu arginylyltransferase
MESLFRYLAPPSRCGYLPEEHWRLEYEVVGRITAAEYMERMARGWRRFGDTLFRPRCPSCNACRSLRVVVDRFRPDRSQRRVRQANEGVVRLEIGRPSVNDEKLRLYDSYHAFQSDFRGWPVHAPKDAAGYANSFVDNPFPTQEWCYFAGERLIGVGYVDDLPGGLSAIYFFYDPDFRHLSLGSWNVLSILDQAASRRIPFVYLGYYVAGCQSMTYKVRFRPNQLLGPDGRWADCQG